MLDIKLTGCLEDGSNIEAPIMDKRGYYDPKHFNKLTPAYNALMGFRLHFDLVTNNTQKRTEVNLEALSWLNQAIAINKDYAWAYLIRSKIYYELNRINEALNNIRKVNKFGFFNDFVLYVKALIHFELDHFYISLNALNLAIEITKNGEILGECQFLKVLVLRKLGIDCFDKLDNYE